MLRLRIIQPGQPDQFVEVPEDEAVVGRAQGVDVLVAQPYVSKRHARVLAGVVVVDLGSRNGVFVDGQRVDGAALLGPGGFRLGGRDEDVSIEVVHEGGDDGAVRRVREELDEERRRAARLEAELGERSAAAEAPPDVEDLPLVRQLRAQRDDLARRVEALKREVESRDVAGSEGLQARLAGDSLAEVQRQNDQLQKRVQELEARAAGPAVEAARAALTERVAQLEGDRAEREEELARLREELATAREAAQPLPASDLFFRLQAENNELRRQLEQAGSAAEAPSDPGELFFELQEEKRRLERELAELRAQPGEAASTPSASPDELEELRRRCHQLELSKADLLTELDDLRGRVAAAPAPLRVAPEAGGVELEVLGRAVQEDVDGLQPEWDGGAGPFLLLELFRFTRQVERVVTRAASGFIQLYESQTILPDMEGNARARVGTLLEYPADRDLREDLVEYLRELQKWLVVALGAHRRGAERFAEELRNELTERGLTASEPIPTYKKLAGLADAELWQRTRAHLKRLTADVVEERIEGLARTCAEEILREQGRP